MSKQAASPHLTHFDDPTHNQPHALQMTLWLNGTTGWSAFDSQAVNVPHPPNEKKKKKAHAIIVLSTTAKSIPLPMKVGKQNNIILFGVKGMYTNE